ncbi:MAG TPA: UDP-N-acetylmuramoyl-L-alanine--D-glutamate ligase [Paenalcaligenes sp.]|nr:UDP-N-acetylmuramoyl-L-alanine--D-glutamate ligase [Paenalcaligenes sp.]
MQTEVYTPSQRILVLGLGHSGAAAAYWCAHQGWSVRLADTRPTPPDIDELRQALSEADAQWVLGSEALDEAVLQGVCTLVLSPGLSPHEPRLKALLEKAEEQGIECINELTLFARALAQAAQQRDYHPQLIAITGTNGKTTVATMVAHLLREHEISVQLAGNISPSCMSAWLAAQQTGLWPEVWVLECSSFQLHSMQDLHPDVATVLNISQDHLDWHVSASDYQNDKMRLLQQAKRVVYHRDDPIVCRAAQALSQPQWSFGRQQPEQERQLGIFVDAQDRRWLAVCDAAGQYTQLLPCGSLSVLGEHNESNALAALALLAALDWPIRQMAEALSRYRGEPHRCEWVRDVRDVRFINDSKGTNVGATVAAIQGIEAPKILIAGGLGKGQDFTPLAEAIRAGDVRHTVLYGADAARIAQTLRECDLPHSMVAQLDSAVEQAFGFASARDVVLFSPACASMDQFENYQARGRAFVDAVSELALDLGEVQ